MRRHGNIPKPTDMDASLSGPAHGMTPSHPFTPGTARTEPRQDQRAAPGHFHAWLRDHGTTACLVLGNGINRFQADAAATSWDALLLELWRTHAFPEAARLPEGLSLTELYDALELRCGSPAPDLQKEFCRLMKDWEPRAQHRRLLTLAQELALPVLTTNFEDTLARAAGAPLRHLEPQGFTDFYPWSSCFAPIPLERPESGFGIWHLNGMSRYARSIRLGLSHYMGSVERARGLLNRGGAARFTGGHAFETWPGRQSWLHLFLTRDLIFVGLGLDASEVFLRWLLIERARFFRQFPEFSRPGWFAHVGPLPEGQRLFLEATGVEPLAFPDFDSLYGP